MGKNVKINVKATWGDKKTSQSIKISATTLADAAKELNKLDEWGKFDGNIGYDFDTDGEVITEVKLKPGYTIDMPVWSGYDKAPQACKDEWDRMYKALVEHEDGHRQILEDTLDSVEKYLGKATDLSEKQLKADMAKMTKAGQANQVKFDSSTDHGAKKGVELNITDDCE